MLAAISVTSCAAVCKPPPRRRSKARFGAIVLKNSVARLSYSNCMISHCRGTGGSGRSGIARFSAPQVPRLWPARCPFPLPSCVIDAPPGRLAHEHILGIYVSRECLARRALHRYVALRSYISLIRDVERRELSNTVVDRQSRCHREIWASRSGSALVLGETTDIGSIIVSRRRRRRCRCITRRRRRCGWRRWLLWGAGSDRETGYTKQEKASHPFLPLGSYDPLHHTWLK